MYTAYMDACTQYTRYTAHICMSTAHTHSCVYMRAHNTSMYAHSTHMCGCTEQYMHTQMDRTHGWMNTVHTRTQHRLMNTVKNVHNRHSQHIHMHTQHTYSCTHHTHTNPCSNKHMHMHVHAITVSVQHTHGCVHITHVDVHT